MSSSLCFGSHVKALSMETTPKQAHVESPAPTFSPEDAYNLVEQPAGGSTAVEYPTEEVAQQLLETVTSSLGTVQHLVDPRSFSDQLASTNEPKEPRGLWEIECLLVFAIGELLQGKLQPDTVLPGARYFQEAVNRVPGFAALRAAGTVGVEIMGLAAFYLQCADCKEDAYIYVSVLLKNEAGERLLTGFNRLGWPCDLLFRIAWSTTRVRRA